MPKCPKCQYKQRRRESSTVCQSCGYKSKIDLNTDNIRLNEYRNITNNGTQPFTPNQLLAYRYWTTYPTADRTAASLFFEEYFTGNYYKDVTNKLFSQYMKGLMLVLIFFGFLGIIASVSSGILDFFRIIIVGIILRSIIFIAGIGEIRDSVKKLYEKYKKNPRYSIANEKVEGLSENIYEFGFWLKDNPLLPPNSDKLFLERPQLALKPTIQAESDIFDYGTEGILVVEESIYVDLLVGGGVHQATKLLIISQRGYPYHLSVVANRLLKTNAELPIFLLHGGNAIPEKMTAELKLTHQPIYDIGFSKQDFDTHEWLKPFNHLAKLPLDILSTNRIETLIREAINIRQQKIESKEWSKTAAIGMAAAITPILLAVSLNDMEFTRATFLTAGTSDSGGSFDSVSDFG